ncbi:MAG: PAS domain S-box protein [Bdellovibrionota bacterium]
MNESGSGDVDHPKNDEFSPSVSTERRLALAKKRLDAVHRSDMIAITYFDRDGSIHEPNDKFLETFELERTDIPGFDWRKCDPEVWREQTKQALDEMILDAKPVSYFKETRTRKGRTIPVSVSISGLDDDDDYDGISMIYDLSELVEAREEAEENRHKADLALEAAKIGLWEYDPKSGTCIWDERCSQMLGVTVDEIENLEMFDGRISPEDMERLRDTMLVALEGEFGESQTVEFKIKVRGREKIICTTGRGFQLSREASPRLTGTMTDVTAARRYEQRLFESEDRFRTMAEAIPQIVFESDPSGEVEWVNRKFFDFTGLAETSNPTQEKINEAIHPDDLEAMRDCWRQSTTSGRPMELQYRLRAVSGEYKWFMVRALPIFDGHGTMLRWIGSCTDIDQQKRMADELKAAKEAAERANKMKTSFLANMSHEIRTPLGAILGFTELLGDANLEPEEREEFLRIVARNGHTLSRIVDDILDLSKVEAGMLTLEKCKFSPGPLIEEVVTLFGERAKSKGLEIKFHACPALPESLISDATRIRQIVSNLISNAIKFTDSGVVDVGVSANDTSWRVRVCDTGIGIKPEQITRLFQPFMQADDSMTRKFGGTGLGLHLSRRLAEALGGELTIEASHVGSGSCFTLSLPIEKAPTAGISEPKTPEIEHPRANVLANHKILVVDDSPDNQVLIQRMLVRRGAIVDFASDGEAAILRAKETPYDLILMDLQMPGVDGFEATKRLRAEGFMVPIVALTAHVIEEVRDQCVEAGCDGFLSKPIQTQDLVKTIEALSLHH